MKRLYFVFIILLLAACKKDELPENNIGTPVFISEVNFNGIDYSLTAGENGLVLNPSVSLTDTSVEFLSELSNPSCPECGPALKMSIASPPSFIPSAGTEWISELSNWNYSFNAETGDTTRILEILASNGNNVSDGNWFLNGEQINSFETSFVELEIQEQGSYELSYFDPDSACVQGTSLNFDYNGSDIPCYGSITQNTLDQNFFFAQPGPAFDPTNTSFLWIVNNLIFSAEDDNITLDADTVNQISVEMMDGSGCSYTANYLPQNSTTTCANNLKIDSTQVVTILPEPIDISLITIEFTDTDGAIYSSTGSQENASIELISIEPYQEPTRPGESFADVEFEVSCNLYNEEGQAFPFSGQINLAISLP